MTHPTTDHQFGEAFARFHQLCTNRVVPCEICHKPVVTSSRNLWAAHWNCVMPKNAVRVEMSRG